VGLHADLGALKPGTPGGEYGEKNLRMEALSPEPGTPVKIRTLFKSVRRSRTP
jgi:hypothetical protein